MKRSSTRRTRTATRSPVIANEREGIDLYSRYLVYRCKHHNKRIGDAEHEDAAKR